MENKIKKKKENDINYELNFTPAGKLKTPEDVRLELDLMENDRALKEMKDFLEPLAVCFLIIGFLVFLLILFM